MNKNVVQPRRFFPSFFHRQTVARFHYSINCLHPVQLISLFHDGSRDLSIQFYRQRDSKRKQDDKKLKLTFISFQSLDDGQFADLKSPSPALGGI